LLGSTMDDEERDGLHRMATEIQQSLINSKKRLGDAQVKLRVKAGERRRAELTQRELQALEADARTYRGVGKMFLATPQPEIVEMLRKSSEDGEREVKKLEESVKYLEKHAQDQDTQLRDVIAKIRAA